ncbi:MAG: TolC family protein [Sandaracinaceae bacterium]
MRRFVLALVLTTPLFAAPAAAQQPLSEFLASASDHALDVRQARAAVSAANNQVHQARGRLLPNGAISGQYTRNEFEVAFEFPPGSGNMATIQAQDQLAATFQINVPIVDISAWASYFAAEEAAGAADAQTEVAERAVQGAVVTMWHQVVTARALSSAAQAAFETAQHVRDNVAARVEVGSAPQLELARATAELERTRQMVAEAELQLALARNNLRNLTGLEVDADRVVALEDDGREEAALESFLGDADDHPAVRAARRSRSAAEANRNAAWLALLPTLSGTLTERVTNASGFSPNSQWALTFNATWSLDFARPAAIAVQDAQLEGAAISVERAEQQATTAIFEAWHRVRTARVQLASARAAEEATTRAAADAQAQFETGVGTQIEQIQAERDRFSAEVGRIQATANLRVARAALRIASGRDVE